MASELLVHQHFQRESQITGNLEHPGIVPVYSAGTHTDGQPYFAMRLIRGVSLEAKIDAFHQTNKDFTSSEFRQLITQFITVCNTVAYAHSKQILHRDLKPANVMIGDYGETLVVDWGLARGWEEDSAPASEFGRGLRAAAHQLTETESGGLVGTLAYMSPEQASGRVYSFQSAADVFSLGATLYHLLTGEPPHRSAQSEQDRELTIQNIQDGKFRPPGVVCPTIPKPLAAICLKTMSRHPGERYASALELAADLERYLADEPLTAYREPFGQRAWRWMKRNRPLVSAVAVALLLLIAGSVAYAAIVSNHNQQLTNKNSELAAAKESLEQAKESLQQKNTELVAANTAATTAQKDAETRQKEAEIAQQEAEDVLEVLKGYLRRPDPALDGEAVTVLRVMELLEKDINKLFHGQPRIQVELLNTIGQTYRATARLQQSHLILQRAVEIAEQELGPEHMLTLDAKVQLAHTLRVLDKLNEAIEHYSTALDVWQAQSKPPQEKIILTTSSLGLAYRSAGQLQLAEEKLAEAHKSAIEQFGREGDETLRIGGRLAAAYLEMGMIDQAVEMLELNLKLRRKLLGEEHPNTLHTMNELGVAYVEAERYEDAIRLHEQALFLTTARFGKEHPRTLTLMHNLASSYLNTNRVPEAIQLLEPAVEQIAQRLGTNQSDTTQDFRATLAKAYLMGKMPEKALPLLKDFVRFRGNQVGLNTIHHAALLRDVCVELLVNQQAAAAEDYARTMVEIFAKQVPGHVETANSRMILGRCLAMQKKFTEAEEVLLAAHEAFLKGPATSPADNRQFVEVSYRMLIQLYTEWQKPAEAKAWTEKLTAWKTATPP